MHKSNKYYVFNQKIDTMFDQLFDKPVNVFCKDKDNHILESNKYNLDMFGASEAEMIGRKLSDFIPEEDNILIEKNDISVMSNKISHIFSEPKHIIRKDNQKIDLLCLKMPMYDDKYHVTGTFGLAFYLAHTSLAEIVFYVNQLKLYPILNRLIASNIESKMEALTLREKEVGHCIARGMCNKEVAKTLDISCYTVKAHITNIKNKLGCYTRSNVIAMLLESWPLLYKK